MHRAAEICIGTQEKQVRCKILDMSDGGARLAISSTIANLPSTFTLVLFKDTSAQRDCEVVWTDNRCVGVKFISSWYAASKRKHNITSDVS